MASKAQLPSRRFPFRFPLYLAGGLIVLAAGFVFWQWSLARRLDQEKALIESKGGQLYFEDEIAGDGELVEGKLQRSWAAYLARNPLNINLHGVKGVRQCLEIAGTYHGLWQIDLSESDLTDKDLSLLEPLRELRHLLLNDTQAGDAVFGLTEKMEHLYTLDLKQTKFTAAGMARWKPPASLATLMLIEDDLQGDALAPLRDHPTLQTLRLCDSKITSEQVKLLGTLKNLEELDLSGTMVGDDVVANLKQFPQLKTLGLAETRVTPEGVEKIADKLSRIVELQLSGLRLSPAAMASIAKIPTLEVLYLSEAEVDDATIEPLLNAPRLREVALDETRVSREAAIRLAKQKGIQTLHLTQSLLTQQDRDELSGERPGLEIIEIPSQKPNK